MGKTIGEWEMYFQQLSNDTLTEVINALETLQKAEMFYEEFEWTHLFTLTAIAKEVKQQRVEVWSKELEVGLEAKYGFTGEDYERLEEEASG